MLPRPRSGLVLVVLSATLLGSCVTRVGGTPISLDDPLGVIGSSEEIRLFLFPAETHVCLGDAIAPAPSLDAPVGTVEGTIVDLLLVSSGAGITQEVSVAPGSYVAYVRAKGTDSFSGVEHALIGQGCAEIDELAANESRGVALRLVPVFSPGDCSDTRLSPDEQCTTPGVDDCDARCQTTPFQLNTSIQSGVQEAPRVAARGSNRMLVTFGSERLEIGARVLGPDARPLSSPALLVEDRTVNDALSRAGLLPLPRPLVSTDPAIAPSGRMAIVTTYARGSDFDVRAGFFDTGFVPEADFVALTASDAGLQNQGAGAFAGDGAFLAAFADASLGVAVRVFAPDAHAPSGEATSIAASGSSPAVAGLGTGFVVAWVAGDRVMLRRVDASGSPTGDAFPAFEEASAQSEPAIAGIGGAGGFVVVCRDSDVDGQGSGIRGRVFDASGAGLEAFVVNSTRAGDQGRPSVAAFEDRIAVAFESAGAVRARFFDARGEPALNRERPPSLDDFPVAASGLAPSVGATGTGSNALWFFAYQAASGDAGNIFGRRIPR